MPRTEEEYENHAIVVEEDDEVTVTIDGEEIELQVDDAGPETLYSHLHLAYRTFEEPVEVARTLIDEGLVP
jgi:hypothetical protein